MARTILFYSVFWVTIAAATPLSVIAILFRLIGLKALVRPVVFAVARGWARLLTAVMGANVIIEGREKVPRSGAVCFVGNHQGDMDTLIALAYFKRSFGFTAKKEAIFLPFIGLWVILLDGVFIDRKHPSKAIKAIRAGAERLRRGEAMIIFPEGTRSRGPKMGEFRSGALKLATLADAVIVPVTFDGSYKVWEAERRVRPETIRVTFHDPIPTAGLDGDSRRALSERVRSIIASALPDAGS